MVVPLKPVILSPYEGKNFSTNVAGQTLSGTVGAGVLEVKINGSPLGVIFDTDLGVWNKEFHLEFGPNVFSVVAVNGDGESEPAVQVITQLEMEEMNLVVTVPTGLIVERFKDKIGISWVENPELEIVGYNVYVSDTPGGGLTGFVKANKNLIDTPKSQRQAKRLLQKQEQQVGAIVQTTTTEELVTLRTYELILLGLPPDFATLEKKTIHFVITAVGFDNTLLEEVESAYSGEISGQVLTIVPAVKDLVPRTELDVRVNQIQFARRSQKDLDIKAGTVFRDIVVDPVADEFRRAYTLLDFFHRTESIITLLEFDDANDDGESDLVADSPLKLALQDAIGKTETETQQLVDDAFDKLAGNVYLTRQEAQQAQGEVTFYSYEKPVENILVSSGAIVSSLPDEEEGIAAISFETLSDAIIPAVDAESFFNPRTKRYEITVPIKAVQAGSAGNVSSGAIRRGVNGVAVGLQIENKLPTQFGIDRESNRRLSERTLVKIAGVDTGTKIGYLSKSLELPGVQRVKVIDAGDPFMFRDWDEKRKKHIGGKVDVYIVGKLLTQQVDKVAFGFPKVVDEPLFILDACRFRFHITNPDVNDKNKVFEVIKITNTDRGVDYNLDGLLIEGGVVIDLDEDNFFNASVGIDSADRLLITYRYRKNAFLVLTKPPVNKIINVRGPLSGDLTGNYHFYKRDDPADLGNSAFARDAVEVFFDAGKPLDAFEIVTDEPLKLVGELPGTLNKQGVISDTIVVKNSDSTITYIRDVDYVIIDGDERTLTKIKRTGLESEIPDGSTVLISYKAGENIEITYVYNDLIRQLQEHLEVFKHATADVIAKEADELPVDIAMTTHTRKGFDETQVKNETATKIAREFQGKSPGQSTFQSDIIGVAERVRGLDFVDVPLAEMARADEDIVIRETIDKPFVYFDIDLVPIFVTSEPFLDFPTLDGGGFALPEGTGTLGRLFGPIHVIQDVVEIFETVESIFEVGRKANRAFVSADGKVYISLKLGDTPEAHLGYALNYRVFGDSGAKDILARGHEVPRLNSLLINLAE